MKSRYGLMRLTLWLVGLGTALSGCNPVIPLPPGGAREFTLIMANMQFIGEKPDSIYGIENPDIIVQTGEHVKITLHNKEKQLINHDFAISNHPNVRLTQWLRPDQSGEVEFVAERPGEFTYYDPLHPTLAVGRFTVLRP